MYQVKNISGRVLTGPKSLEISKHMIDNWAIGQVDYVADEVIDFYRNHADAFTILSATDHTVQGLLYVSATTGIVAHAGGGQASATALTTSKNRVSTVATAGDSVVLPAAIAGLSVEIYNDGANNLAVFPAGATDTINDLGAATAVTQIPNSIFTYSCTAAGLWECESVGSGFAGNLPTVSSANGITAFATGGQASAVLLTAVINRVTTVGTAADSVKMPPAVPGLMLNVTNAAAVNSMNLFPNTGDAINAGAANAAYAIVAGKTAILSCAVAGQWHAVLSA